MCSHLMPEQINVAVRHYVLSARSRSLEKLVLTLVPIEDLPRATRVNIDPLPKHRHSCVRIFAV